MKILICDDDQAFAQKMNQRLEAYAKNRHLKIQIDTVCDPITASRMSFEVYDIAFLDIDMGAVNGMDLANRLRRERKDAIIIFVTNFAEFAPDGYEVQAFRYLVKNRLDERLPTYFSEAIGQFSEQHKVIQIRVNYEGICVPINSILYIESRGHVLIMHLINESRSQYQFNDTIALMAEKLNAHGFIMIHKSYLVNLKYITKLNCNSAMLTGNLQIPVSERRYAEVKSRLMLWRE